ncbi:MAG: hypothetical protein MZW92_23105 [Comamonadaceae bacterium]|nr:hypothetical protein [Comamonadaceae bacterium]
MRSARPDRHARRAGPRRRRRFAARLKRPSHRAGRRRQLLQRPRRVDGQQRVAGVRCPGWRDRGVRAAGGQRAGRGRSWRRRGHAAGDSEG